MNVQTRAVLAQHASLVEGVVGHPYKPAELNVGDAWPQWAGATRDERTNAFYEQYTLTVVCARQGDYETADSWIDANAEALLDALGPVLFVDAFDPVEIPMQGGAMIGLQLTGRM